MLCLRWESYRVEKKKKKIPNGHLIPSLARTMNAEFQNMQINITACGTSC
jgi:hypothetical protein